MIFMVSAENKFTSILDPHQPTQKYKLQQWIRGTHPSSHLNFHISAVARECTTLSAEEERCLGNMKKNYSELLGKDSMGWMEDDFFEETKNREVQVQLF